MTKRDFAWNIRIGVMLFIAVLFSAILDVFGFIDVDLYVQAVLGMFLLFLIFRIVAPFIFTKMDKYGTPEMQKNFREHFLGRFFLILDDN